MELNCYETEENEYWLCLRCGRTFDLAEEGTYIKMGFICGQCWEDITAEQGGEV